jgi:hypothetical protein
MFQCFKYLFDNDTKQYNELTGPNPPNNTNITVDRQGIYQRLLSTMVNRYLLSNNNNLTGLFFDLLLLSGFVHCVGGYANTTTSTGNDMTANNHHQSLHHMLVNGKFLHLTCQQLNEIVDIVTNLFIQPTTQADHH